MTNLTSFERERINASVNALKNKTFLVYEQTKQHDDLIGLYQDIIQETSKHGNVTIIFDYAKLLELENSYYCAHEAYFFAKNSTATSTSAILKQYHLNVSQKMNTSGIELQKHNLFNEIHSMLGDAHGLIADFTEMHRKVNGAVAQNIVRFIKQGHNAKQIVATFSKGLSIGENSDEAI